MRSCHSMRHKVFHFEVSISAPRLDLGPKPQQILTLARARSILDFHPLGVKTRNDSDQRILAAFEDATFGSVRQLSRLTHLSLTTTYRRLTESLGFVASPSMGTTCSVTCAKGRESQSVPATIANANGRSPARSRMV
jgi:hypothetical protein